MATIAVHDDTFVQEVLEAEGPVLVDFWATWCAPCKMVAPILEEISEEFQETLKVVKVDVDHAPQVQAQFRIRSIPTLMVFEGGKVVQAVQGALPKPALMQFLTQSVPGLRGPSMTVDALDKALRAGRSIRIFDIRDPRDFSRSHLRHAQCVAPDDLVATISDLPAETEVVLIDRQGIQAQEVAKTVNSEVPQSVVALESGLLEWEGSGRPTYSDKEEAALDAEVG